MKNNFIYESSYTFDEHYGNPFKNITQEIQEKVSIDNDIYFHGDFIDIKPKDMTYEMMKDYITWVLNYIKDKNTLTINNEVSVPCDALKYYKEFIDFYFNDITIEELAERNNITCKYLWGKLNKLCHLLRTFDLKKRLIIHKSYKKYKIYRVFVIREATTNKYLIGITRSTNLHRICGDKNKTIKHIAERFFYGMYTCFLDAYMDYQKLIKEYNSLEPNGYNKKIN